MIHIHYYRTHYHNAETHGSGCWQPSIPFITSSLLVIHKIRQQSEQRTPVSRKYGGSLIQYSNYNRISSCDPQNPSTKRTTNTSYPSKRKIWRHSFFQYSNYNRERSIYWSESYFLSSKASAKKPSTRKTHNKSQNANNSSKANKHVTEQTNMSQKRWMTPSPQKSLSTNCLPNQQHQLNLSRSMLNLNPQVISAAKKGNISKSKKRPLKRPSSTLCSSIVSPIA